MSDTPRTDGESINGFNARYSDYYVSAAFACQLERELAEAQSKLAEISITHGKWMADALRAGAELAESKRDSARLDWLCSLNSPAAICTEDNDVLITRDQIDAAMQASK